MSAVGGLNVTEGEGSSFPRLITIYQQQLNINQRYGLSDGLIKKLVPSRVSLSALRD